MKGGRLCDKYNDQSGKDTYTLGEHAFPGIYADKNDPDVLIKIIRDKGEYELAKYLAHNDFVPKVYGFFNCTNTESIAKYSIKQQRIKARNFSNPGKKPEPLGDISYESKDTNVMYMVMEKIDGNSLGEQDLSNHIDEIYRLYNILADKGITLDDLAARNIILSDKGKIYLIDFEPVYTTITHSSIPLDKRISKETLLKMLPSGPANYRSRKKRNSKKSSGGSSSKSRKRRRSMK
jgi:serine/threonine protein kinase